MSKELEALKTILQWFDDEHFGMDEFVEESEEWKIVVNAVKAGIKFRTISQDNKITLNKIENALKALKIIKEKEVDIWAIKYCSSLKQYNCKEDGRATLTQEEYDLLKEVLL